MGRDAGGHGHNAGEQGNPWHTKSGEFGEGGGGDTGKGDSGASFGKRTTVPSAPNAGNKAAFALREKMKEQSPKASAEKHRVAEAKSAKEAATYKQAKAEDKSFDQKQTAEYRAAKAEDHARDRAARVGDHQNAQQHFGHGAPIRAHQGQASVGTGGGGGGGGSGLSSGGAGGGSRLGGGMKHRGVKITRQATKERVALRQQADAGRRAVPSETDMGQITQGRMTNVPQSKRRM